MKRRLGSLAAAVAALALGACAHMYVAGDAGPHRADVDRATVR